MRADSDDSPRRPDPELEEGNRPMLQYAQNRLDAARAQTGQTMAEYAIVLAVITLVVVAAITALSGAISSDLTKVTNIL
jgi:Flp pilus assembly pilin Flp